MRTEGCREWRESLGAYALDGLSAKERAGIEAHLEGCAECGAELDSLALVARLLPHADPAHFGPAPVPPPALAERVAAMIGAEQDGRRRRSRVRIGLALSGATAVATAAVLAIFVLPGGVHAGPEQSVSFGSLPDGVRINATLEPRTFGTEIQMYVSGIRSGTLCKVFLRGPNGARASAGTFRYRYGGEGEAVLSSALDLSRSNAIGVRAGGRTFIAPIAIPARSISPTHTKQDNT